MPRAAICTAIDEPVEIADIDIKDPQAGEVRVRLGASGVCHSDLSVQNGTILIPTPVVLGHEGAGVIEDVGEGVDNLHKGDHVVISWVPQCGECYFCEYDQGHLCDSGNLSMATNGLLDGTYRFERDGQGLGQMAASGTWSEETIVPAIGAVKVDADIPMTAAALIGCGHRDVGVDLHGPDGRNDRLLRPRARCRHLAEALAVALEAVGAVEQAVRGHGEVAGVAQVALVVLAEVALATLRDPRDDDVVALVEVVDAPADVFDDPRAFVT